MVWLFRFVVLWGLVTGVACGSGGGSTDCVSLCRHVRDKMCGDPMVTCESDCQRRLAGACSSQYARIVACGIGADVVCQNGASKIPACFTVGEQYGQCLASADGGTTP